MMMTEEMGNINILIETVESKSTIMEVINLLDGHSSRLETAEENINKLENT